MVVKIVSLFLVVILALAVFGKLGWLGSLAPGALRRSGRKPGLCHGCGRHIIGSNRCACGVKPKKKG
ncbi:hypothetical protein EOK75_10580 [Pseudorhodobacter turbinis]|uniref:Uncharacterized protein n=1 Tax=Pseudorhodobacter turbinis TaxID=2500533 RepID=A0A4P8EHG7_9RHOB|nr:hypothetical protein EOK75_10580 [Pseudorhodobacter turbinis]